MVNNLLERSLVDKVYVSASSLASSPFNERDLNKKKELNTLEPIAAIYNKLKLILLH